MPIDFRVALLIGDISGKISEMPTPFDKMAESFRTHPNRALCETITVGDHRVEITAISISRCVDNIAKLEDNPYWKSYATDISNRHRLAVAEAVYMPDSPFRQIEDLSPQVVIIGMTILYEAIASRLATIKQLFYESDAEVPDGEDTNFFNPLIIRFSTFYSGSSMHSGNNPESIGYNLDMFKSLKQLDMFLRDENCLKAINNQNKDELIAALEDLNQKPEFIYRPILILS